MSISDRDPSWESFECERCGEEHTRAGEDLCGDCERDDEDERAEAMREGFVAFRRRGRA